MYNQPVTFKQATDQIASRMDTPTAMKYTQLTAAWDDQFRRRAFFSARVAEADLLGELHKKAQDVAEGRMSKDQARRLIREYFVGDGADALARLGFAPPKDARGIAQLGSIPRLELILDTNVRMAQETGHYKKWETLKDVYPYGVWRVGYSKVHREAHLERDGKVYAFDHPIWRESPPGGEFNCHCRRDLMTADELAASGLRPVPKTEPFQKSSLGFDPGADEWGDVPFGKTVPEDVKEVAEEELKRDESVMQADEAATRLQLIDQQKAYADTLLEKFDADAKTYREDAETQYAAMQSDIERMEQLDARSPERARIVERWKKEDEDAKAAIEKERDDLMAQRDAALEMEKAASEQYGRTREDRSLTTDERGDGLRELHQQVEEASRNKSKYTYLYEQATWKLEIVKGITFDARSSSSVAREIRKSRPWMTTVEAKASAEHEMTLNARRMAGTALPLYRREFAVIGQRPAIVFEKPTRLGAYYMNVGERGQIHMDRRYGTWNSSPFTIIHEYGHWLDYHTRMKPSIATTLGIAPSAFIDSGTRDVDALLGNKPPAQLRDEFGYANNYSGTFWLQDIARALFGKTGELRGFSMDERELIISYADTMQSITRGRYGWGHAMSYAMNWRNVGVEAFAETYHALMTKDERFRIAYPQMTAYIIRLLDIVRRKGAAL